jgi:glycosyltransferase involved in cell wall biosynthesis
VAHVPSKAAIKGTPLVEPVLERLVAQGRVNYERISGVPSSKMPAVYAAADIVLDQFRLGSYGVAACEAMAAGCVVVGHVAPFVRATVRETTGEELPIVEATADTLEKVLASLVADRDARISLGDRGRDFVGAVHGGGRSARVLLDEWILA